MYKYFTYIIPLFSQESHEIGPIIPILHQRKLKQEAWLTCPGWQSYYETEQKSESAGLVPIWF